MEVTYGKRNNGNCNFCLLYTSNNLNQVAVHAHTYGVYPEEIDGLKRDYEKLWGEVSKAVSYTHLDVYKRQSVGRASISDQLKAGKAAAEQAKAERPPKEKPSRSAER